MAAKVSYFVLGVWMGLSVATGSTLARAGCDEAPVSDVGFEKRLVREQTYTTRKGDTLCRVAGFLYGHRTWAFYLRQQNPSLREYESEAFLPVGIQITYRAPEIGSSYVIQSNDWLSRIGQWRYGSPNHWREIYQQNQSVIGNPHLIHPGSVIALADLSAPPGEPELPSQPSVEAVSSPSAIQAPRQELQLEPQWVAEPGFVRLLKQSLLLFVLGVGGACLAWLLFRGGRQVFRHNGFREFRFLRLLKKLTSSVKKQARPKRSTRVKTRRAPPRLAVPSVDRSLFLWEEGQLELRPSWQSIQPRLKKSYR